jgi:hypothetical protein
VEILLIRLERGGGGKIIGQKGVNKNGEEINAAGEAFADDLTVLFKMREGAAKKILEILDDFGKISGLQINREKTHIMVTGKEWEGMDNIEGIAIQKECRLLGIVLDHKVQKLDKNWDKVIKTISGLTNYWNQYNLTITGRVLVAKTFLLSQATFLMGILPLGEVHCKKIEQLIEAFTLGRLQIARDRIYNKVEQGGTGLIRIRELEIAMKSSWINRWNKEGEKADVTGSRVIKTAEGGKIEKINVDRLRQDLYPCAVSIAKAWSCFREKVYQNDGNFYSATIFGNPGIRNRMGEMLGRGNVFSNERYDEVKELIADKKFGEICLEKDILAKEEIERMWDIGLSRREYGKLGTVIKYIRGKYKPSWHMKHIGKSIEDWLRPIKKGSNKLRTLMSGRGSREYRAFTFDKIRPIVTLWEQLTEEKDECLISYGMLLWKIKELNADLRQFIFKWNQGMVHGNTVISHFGEVDRKCTFCKIPKIRELENRLGREATNEEKAGLVVVDEDRKHIYWECPTVQEAIQRIYRGLWEVDVDVERRDFLMGRRMVCAEAMLLYMCINMFIKYKIWKYKLAEVTPNINCIIRDVNIWLRELTRYNKWRIMLPLVRRQIEG